MTRTYCDFCSKLLDEDDPGDPVVLGDPESITDARKDACAKCFEKISALVIHVVNRSASRSQPKTIIPASQDEADRRLLTCDLHEIWNWLPSITPQRLRDRLSSLIAKAEKQ